MWQSEQDEPEGTAGWFAGRLPETPDELLDVVPDELLEVVPDDDAPGGVIPPEDEVVPDDDAPEEDAPGGVTPPPDMPPPWQLVHEVPAGIVG